MKRKIIITDEVSRALDQLWYWARCEASTAVCLPIWQVIVKAIEIEKEDDEQEYS